jgi:hypothetical protein
MAEFGDATDVLMDSDTYVEDVGAGFAGYAAPSVVDNLLDRTIGMDVPDEAAGLAVIVLAEMYGGAYKRPMQAGAGAYTGEAFASRVGIRDTVVNLGGGN